MKQGNQTIQIGSVFGVSMKKGGMMKPLEFNHRKKHLLDSLNIQIDDIMKLQSMTVHDVCKELFENEDQKLLRALAYTIYHQYTELGKLLVTVGFLMDLNASISPSKKASKQVEYIENKLLELLHHSKPDYQPSSPAENPFGLTLGFFQAESLEFAKLIAQRIQEYHISQDTNNTTDTDKTTAPLTPFQIDKSIIN